MKTKNKVMSELFLLWILTLIGMLAQASVAGPAPLKTEESRYILLELTKVAPDRDSTLTAMYFDVTLKPDEPGYPMTLLDTRSRLIYDEFERVPGTRYPTMLEPIKPYFVSKDGRRMKFKMLADAAELGDVYPKYNPIAQVTMQYRRCYTDTAGQDGCEVKVDQVYMLTDRDWVLDGLEHVPGHAVTAAEPIVLAPDDYYSLAVESGGEDSYLNKYPAVRSNFLTFRIKKMEQGYGWEGDIIPGTLNVIIEVIKDADSPYIMKWYSTGSYGGGGHAKNQLVATVSFSFEYSADFPREIVVEYQYGLPDDESATWDDGTVTLDIKSYIDQAWIDAYESREIPWSAVRPIFPDQGSDQ